MAQGCRLVQRSSYLGYTDRDGSLIYEAAPDPTRKWTVLLVRLTINVELVGCIIGRSAGLMPPSIVVALTHGRSGSGRGGQDIDRRVRNAALSFLT
jgi:hypothetical protein